MADRSRRGGLGRGLGALIPTAPARVEPTDPAEPEDDAESGSSVPDTAGPASGTVPAADPGAVAERAGEAALVVGSAPDDHPDPSGLRPVDGAEFAEIPLDSIHTNPQQPRQVFDEDALLELAHSVREFGVLQPVVVRRSQVVTGAGGEAVQQYELVMGERRLRAARLAELGVIPAIVRSTADDAMLRDALLENIHRAQLNPLEEAAAYQQLLEEFGTTHEELAQRIGRSRPQITNTIRLLNLSVPVQRRVAAGVLTAGHARALLSLSDVEAQDELAGRIVAEGLSVRATEELVALQARGDGGASDRRSAGARVKMSAPGATELADRLADVFDTRVRVELGRRKGRVVVEFASLDDLERIVGLMSPAVLARAKGIATGPDAPAGAD